MDRRTQRSLLLLLVLGLVVLLYRQQQQHHHQHYRPSRSANVASGTILAGAEIDTSELEPANATLGFGAVVAVSRDASPRREGLLLAANITEINIVIPDQPVWTDADVDRLRNAGGSGLGKGSALAWLGHLNALRWFLGTDLETILIFEDDVDWDIRLRTTQIPQAAAAIRRLTANATDPPASTTAYVPAENNYWGNASAWDLLYLGHCGDIFHPMSWSDAIPRLLYQDPTVLPHAQLHPYTAKFLQTISIPEGVRLIHQSIFPLCTFGFALTRNAAYRLLTEIAAHEPPDGKMAYDVMVLEACRDYGFRCWSASPELFHHIDSESEIAQVDDGVEIKVDKVDSLVGLADKSKDIGPGFGSVGADAKGRLKPLRAGTTPNIACGIRNRNFFTRDSRTLAFLREYVGRRGKCLRDSGEDDAYKVPDGGDWKVPDGWHDPRLD